MVSFEMGLSWVKKELKYFAKAPKVVLNFPAIGFPVSPSIRTASTLPKRI